MTHALHRTGSIDALKDDYAFIIRTEGGINREGKEADLRRMTEILLSVAPNNMGAPDFKRSLAAGLTPEQFVEQAWSSKGVYCAYSSREQAKEALRRIKEADLGLCVTISGLIDEVFAMGKELGVQPHTINLSLGVMGKTELLPENDILDMDTMCGHAMVSKNLTRKMMADVKAGNIGVEEAAAVLAEPCVCGIFNLARACGIVSRKAPAVQ